MNKFIALALVVLSIALLTSAAPLTNDAEGEEFEGNDFMMKRAPGVNRDMRERLRAVFEEELKHMKAKESDKTGDDSFAISQIRLG
jgi:hypothetical protein